MAEERVAREEPERLTIVTVTMRNEEIGSENPHGQRQHRPLPAEVNEPCRVRTEGSEKGADERDVQGEAASGDPGGAAVHGSMMACERHVNVDRFRRGY
jgi:hypothetical protein